MKKKISRNFDETFARFEKKKTKWSKAVKTHELRVSDNIRVIGVNAIQYDINILLI